MQKALENATAKGHAVLYREKILPALSLNKSPRYNNSLAVKIVSEEAKKKFIDNWKNTKVDIATDIARRSKIEAIVKPLIGTDNTKAMIDIPEVKTLIGDVRVCWVCLSSTCLLRQRISGKITGKKLVNRYYMTRKTVLGDKNLLTSLQSPVGKDNHVSAYEKKNKKINENFSATVIKKAESYKQPAPAPTE